jgi:hypothetical protein
MRGSFTFGLQRWVRGGNICRDMHLGVDHRSEGGKLGIEGFKMGSEFLFDVFNFGVDGGMHVFLYGGNIGTELSHFLMGLYEIRVQGIEASFQFLATSVGHYEEGK